MTCLMHLILTMLARQALGVRNFRRKGYEQPPQSTILRDGSVGGPAAQVPTPNFTVDQSAWTRSNTARYFGNCQSKKAVRSGTDHSEQKLSLAKQSAEVESTMERLKAESCTGQTIGFIALDGWKTSCCTILAYCGGCGATGNGMCQRCQGGYRLMGVLGTQKCTMCDDMAGWMDQHEQTCADYERLGICKDGQKPAKDQPFNGLKPSDACCICGGGELKETPWKYPESDVDFYRGQQVVVKPTPQTAFRYEVEQGCGLAKMGLSLNEDGNVVGTVTSNAVGQTTKCTVKAIQDPLQGLESTAELRVSVQEISYGPRVVTFVIKDGTDMPSKTLYELQPVSTTDVAYFTKLHWDCVPLIPWVTVSPAGHMTYVNNQKAASGGVSQKGSSSFDGGQCTLNGTIDQSGETTHVGLKVIVIRVQIWSSMHYKSDVVARVNRPIVAEMLRRRRLDGFTLYVDKMTKKEYWYKKNGEVGQAEWVPPAKRPEILDVHCEAMDENNAALQGMDVRWSRQTGAVTIRGQTAFSLNPKDGEVSGTPVLDLPERLGRPTLLVKCNVGAGGVYYTDVLTALISVTISDDTCYFPMVPSSMVVAVTYSGTNCRMECRRRVDCAGYWKDSADTCFLQTSDTSGVGTSVDEITVRTACSEGVTCMQIQAKTASFIEGKYCPVGFDTEHVTVYSKAGSNIRDQLFMSKSTCPLPGDHSGSQWVLRRQGARDNTNPKTGVFELRGDPVGCIKGDIEDSAFSTGSTKADFVLSETVTSNAVTPVSATLEATVSLTARECAPPTSANGLVFGPFNNPGKYSLDPCECFGKLYRDNSAVTDESRAASGKPTDEEYNLFQPPPQLLAIGPFTCEDDSVLPEGQFSDLTEDQCRSNCLSTTVCKFFSYVAASRQCTLYQQCSRIGSMGMSVENKIWGVFGTGSYCRIADPELCWSRKLRRELLEGKSMGKPGAAGAVDGSFVAGIGCAFQEQIASCDVLEMVTTESGGKCSRCEYYASDAPAASGRLKIPMPPGFPAGTQVAASCPGSNSKLLNTRTRLVKAKAVLTCVDGTWRGDGSLEALSIEAASEQDIEVLPEIPQLGDQAYQGSASWAITDFGDFSSQVMMYVKATKTDESRSPASVMWTLESPLPVVVYLNFPSNVTDDLSCTSWLNSGWLKITMDGVLLEDSNGATLGPGQVYRRDFSAGHVAIYGPGTCSLPLMFIKPIESYEADQNKPLETLVCEDCIHLAGYDYKDLLMNDAPEVYFMQRRKVQAHYGDAMLGCQSASQEAPAPLLFEKDRHCIVVSSSGAVSASIDDCTELFHMDEARRLRIVSSGKCLQGGAQVSSAVCDDGAQQKFFFRDGRLVNEESFKCLTYSSSGPVLSKCVDTPLDTQKLSFDGGNCRYDMELQFMESPFTWKFRIGDGAYYGLQDELSTQASLPASKALVDAMAYGTCSVSLVAKLPERDEQMMQNISMINAQNQPVHSEYNRAFFVLLGNTVLYACSPGGSGGVKAYLDAKREKEKKLAELRECNTTCYPAIWKEKRMNARMEAWSNGLHGALTLEAPAGAGIAVLYSYHDNEKEDRRWQFTHTAGVSDRPNNEFDAVTINGQLSEKQVGRKTGGDLECGDNGPGRGVLTFMHSTFSGGGKKKTKGWGWFAFTKKKGGGDNDRHWTWKCGRVSGLHPANDGTYITVWSSAAQDWRRINDWDGEMNWPTELNADEAAKWWIAGFKKEWDGGRADGRFSVKPGQLCTNRIRMVKRLMQEIKELEITMNAVSQKESQCAQDLNLPVADVQSIEITYPSSTKDAQGKKMTHKCHLLHVGDPAVSTDDSHLNNPRTDAYILTGPQLSNMLRKVVYHATRGGDPTLPPFSSSSADPAKAIRVGHFAQVNDGLTVWGLSCPTRSVVAVHEGSKSPMCTFVNADTDDRVLSATSPSSARCPSGFASGGWWNIDNVAMKEGGVGGPNMFTSFELICRGVPGLGDLCEVKEMMCGADELVAGIEYVRLENIGYLCCKFPHVVGHLFAGRHVARLQPWEGYFCPTRLDRTGRPEYELVHHSGPAENFHGEELFPTKQFTTIVTANPELYCPPGMALSQMKQIRLKPDNHGQFTYTCVHVGVDPHDAFGFHKDGCQEIPSIATCPASYVLQYVKVRSQAAGPTPMKSRCCKLNQGSQKITGSSAAWESTRPETMDLRCGEGQAMSEWGGKSTFKCSGYKIRTPAPAATVSLKWDKLKGAWAIAQASAWEARTAVVPTDGRLLSLKDHGAMCETGSVLRGFRLMYHGANDIINMAFTCVKARSTGPATSTDAPQTVSNTQRISSLGDFGTMACADTEVMTGFQGSQAGAKLKFRYHCINARKAGTDCRDLNSKTARIDSISALPDAAVFCNNDEALASLKFVTDKFSYKCCPIVPETEQVAGDPGSSAKPQEVSESVDKNTRPLLRIEVGSAVAKFEIQYKVVYSGSASKEIHVVVLDEITYDALETREYDASASDSDFAAYINGLKRHRLVLVARKDAASQQAGAKTLNALQYLGSKVQSAESKYHALIGRVGGDALKEQYMASGAITSAFQIPIFVAAPIGDFTAAFITKAGKEDPFPKEKPMKPALLSFAVTKPDYDLYCEDKDFPIKDESLGKYHPCARVWANEITGPATWRCSDRELDRGLLEDTAEVSYAESDAGAEKIDEIFEILSSSLQVVYTAVLAAYWGSSSVASGDAAEGTSDGAEAGAKKTANKKARRNAVKMSEADEADMHDKLKQESALKEAAQEKFSEMYDMKTIGQEAVGEIGMAAQQGFGAKNNYVTEGLDRKSLYEEAHEYVPTILPPDQYGYNEAENTWALGDADANDCASPEFGFAKLFCDSYCNEDAILKGNDAIITSLTDSNNVLTTNFERLIDYHNQMALWGMGKVRDKLLPPMKEIDSLKTEVNSYHTDVQTYRQLEEEWQKRTPDAAGALLQSPTDQAHELMQDIRSMSRLLDVNMSRMEAPEASTVAWHARASEQLLKRVNELLDHATPSTLASVAKRVHGLVQKFAAERNLRFKQKAPKGAEGTSQLTDYHVRTIRQYLNAARSKLNKISVAIGSAAPIAHHAALELDDELVVLRWNQLSDAFIHAHERHTDYVDARTRALAAADNFVDDLELYLACGLEANELSESWEAQKRAEEFSDGQLLQAWAATAAALERLQLSVDQGLLDKTVTVVKVHPPEDNLRCGDFQQAANRVYVEALKNVEIAFAPLTAQMLTIQVMLDYQQGQMRKRNLKGVSYMPLKPIAQRLASLLTVCGDPSTPEGRSLAVRALDGVGAAACPAPAGCRGMRVLNGTFGAWTSLRPGEIVQGRAGAKGAVVACAAARVGATDNFSLMGVYDLLRGISQFVLRLTGVHEAGFQAPTDTYSSAPVECDSACHANLTVRLRRHLSVLTDFVHRMRLL